jgi:hypothetical protein
MSGLQMKKLTTFWSDIKNVAMNAKTSDPNCLKQRKADDICLDYLPEDERQRKKERCFIEFLL